MHNPPIGIVIARLSYWMLGEKIVGETDTPDFNKARGYLIGFSTVVLLLWYFGADLSTFKLLGNEIRLKENVQNVWMVLAGINAYLWLRLYQRTPEGSFRFDLTMHDLYEKTLIRVVRRLGKKQMRNHVLELIEKTPGTVDGEFKLISFNPKGKMTRLERTPPKGTAPQTNSRWFESWTAGRETKFAILFTSTIR